ncbi:unnamed protein product [Clonostachys rosea]|uniref:Endonuclease/exonuclease/phosphatase domain-containing protein n=1 Tax=Bionectria ochroleuca TaxID=29856 RepID=A0ABY6TSQ1_BIOOC|nr:unnamed protein product [Clonostachys rosea]
MALLSKACFKSQSSEDHAIVGPVTRFELPSHYGRDALCVDVFIKSRLSDTKSQEYCRLRLINVHLDSLSSTLDFRKQQVAHLSKILQGDEVPIRQYRAGIIAGDFNAISPEDQGLIEKNGLKDAWLHLHGDHATDSQKATWIGNKESEDARPSGSPGPLIFCGFPFKDQNMAFMKQFSPHLIENSDWTEKE